MPEQFAAHGCHVRRWDGQPIFYCRWRWSARLLAWRMSHGLPHVNPVARERAVLPIQ